MASSAVSALKKVLLVAVCVMLLLHSSMAQQAPTTSPASTSPYTSQQPPPPASPGCPYTGQQPPPPSPVPTSSPPPPPPPPPPPLPTPTPAPAPAPVNCSPSDCATQCSPICQANHDAGIAKCESDLAANVKGCYDVCSRFCPGDSCAGGSGSGCGFFTHCPCDNTNATSCCQGCGNGVYAQYQTCWHFYDKAVGYCMTDCGNTCIKNCTPPAVPPPPAPAPTPTPTPPPPAPTPTPAPTPPTAASPAPAPISNCNFSVCASQCTPSCQASYHPSNCTSLLEAAFNGCYESMINHTCPGKSCDHSGCGFGNCSCNNPRARSCCEFCSKNAVVTTPGSSYWLCQNYNERYMGNCMMSCLNQCSKNCPQQGA